MRLQYCILQKAPSNVSIGLAYELLALKVLRSYSFHIRHTGRRGDRGQDFIGHWVLPNQRVPVVGQCKHHTKPLSPGDVREFENVLQRKGAYHLTCTGILVSHSGFSTKAVETFQSSKAAMILCQIKPRPVSSILSWNSTGNHGNSNPGNHTGGSHSDHADSNGYPLELETEDSTAHKDMQSTATECSHAHNSGERSHAHNSGERSHAHNSGERSHTHNSGERSHAHNNGERSHAHNSGERSHAHNSGERSCAHNSGGRSHAHNSGEHSYLHNSGEPSHAHNSGIIREFALNSKAQKLLTNLKVTWRQDSFTSSFEGRGEVVLLYSIRGKLHNIQNAMEKEGTSSELKLLIF